MKQKFLWIPVLLAALLLTGCAAVPQLISSWFMIAGVETTGPSGPIVEEEISPVRPQAVEAVVQRAAQDHGVAVDRVEVISVENMEWPNACLGLNRPGQMCAQVITPGYRVVVQIGEQQYIYRTDLAGGTVQPDRAAPDVKSEPAAMVVRQMLMQQLGADFNAIEFVEVAQVDWPDGCLGLAAENELCTAMIVPGYRVVLAVNGEHYAFRTDAEVTTIRLESAPEAQIGDVIVEWTQSQDEGVCASADIGRDGVAFGPCGLIPMPVRWVNPERSAELEAFAGAYAPFEAETAAGHVVFTGEGAQAATPAEQRMIAEWARLVQLEAAGGRSGAGWGLAFAWHREGGIAGFCDDLAVYVTGQVYASSCKSSQPVDLGQTRLDAEQLAQVYAWVDTLQPFEVDHTDDAVADAMTTRMTFSGAGDQTAGDDEIAAIEDFAAQLYADLSQ